MQDRTSKLEAKNAGWHLCNSPLWGCCTSNWTSARLWIRYGSDPSASYRPRYLHPASAGRAPASRIGQIWKAIIQKTGIQISLSSLRRAT